MAKITKREHKKMTKAFNNRLAGGDGGSGSTQIQKRRILPKIYLDDDEFTTHSGIKQISTEFVQSAMDLENFYQGGKKKLIVAFAYDLEVELKRLGQDRLVSKISTFIMKLLKQARIKWSPIYLRRCLDNRYKEPINQANALARKKHPGLPQDSGQTVEELEAALQAEQEMNKRTTVGEYVVSSTYGFTLTWDNRKEFEKTLGGKEKDGYQYLKVGDKRNYDGRFALEINTPIIIKANVKERNATVEMDLNQVQKMNETNKELDKQEKRKEQSELSKSKSKSKSKPKSKSNPDTKPIPKTKQPNSPREEEARQIIENLEGNLKAAKTSEEANQIVENFKKELRDFTEAKPEAEAKDPDQ